MNQHANQNQNIQFNKVCDENQFSFGQQLFSKNIFFYSCSTTTTGMIARVAKPTTSSMHSMEK